MAVTQQQIAMEANVSRSTVAAVMSAAQCGRISPEVRRRVREVADRLGYRPNRYAQSTSGGRSGLVGVLGFGTRIYVSQEKLQLATQRFIEEKYEVVMQDVDWFPIDEKERGEALCQRMLDARVEGVLLLHPNIHFQQRHLDLLLKQKLPVVAIAGDHLKGIPTFVSDRHWIYYSLARHLFELGRRRLALLATSELAVNAARDALADSGGQGRMEAFVLKTDDSLQWPFEERSFRLGKEGADAILKSGFRPDAILCSNDGWAHGVLRACREAGLRVPEEISVVGADDEPFGRFGTTPLTTVAHPSSAIAAAAAEELLRLMKTGDRPEEKVIKIRGELVKRFSCGAHLPKEGCFS